MSDRPYTPAELYVDRWKEVMSAGRASIALRETLAYYGLRPLDYVDGTVRLTQAQQSTRRFREIALWRLDPRPNPKECPDLHHLLYNTDADAPTTRRFYATVEEEPDVTPDAYPEEERLAA
jgi:hypothetical protein